MITSFSYVSLYNVITMITPHLICRGYVSFTLFVHTHVLTHTSVKHYFHIIRASCRLTVTRRVPLIEQERIPFRNTCVHPCFVWGSSCSIFTFLWSVLWIIACAFCFGNCSVFPPICDV